MRRTLAIVLIVTGLLGGGLALSAQPAAAATRLGGINVNEACRDQYGPYFGEAYLRTNNAYGWRCRHMEIVCYSWACAPVYSSIGPINMNSACRDQYGRGAYARLVDNHARGWKCFR